MMAGVPGFDRSNVLDELESARQSFKLLASEMTTGDDRRRASVGTRWTNHQLLFHMLLGYLLVWPLLGVMGVFGRMPRSFGRRFAGLLDCVTGAFNAVNFWGACAGAAILSPGRIGAIADRVIVALERRVLHYGERSTGRAMPFPTRWDPFFTDDMAMADLYRYPTQHFRFHERQLGQPTK
jgi:hypothetical protein